MKKGRGNSGATCCGRGARWRERESEGGRLEGGNRAPGRRGTNIVGTPRAVTNDSIDARTEKLEPEENRRSFTGTEEPTSLLSSLFSSPSFPLHVCWTIVDGLLFESLVISEGVSKRKVRKCRGWPFGNEANAERDGWLCGLAFLTTALSFPPPPWWMGPVASVDY